MTEFNRAPETGIRVIIIGTGFAGLTAAIECHRKGHSVLILESFTELKVLGDVISFGPNSVRIFHAWPGMQERLDPICHETNEIQIRTWEGELILNQSWKEREKSWGRNYNGHRGQIHQIVFDYAVEIGIDIRLGHRVVDYFETETEAGVVANGQTFVGDVVLAADGVRSKGRTIVLGYEDKPKASGYAVYRAWFDVGKMAEDPDFDFLFEKQDDLCIWIGKQKRISALACQTNEQGQDIHFIAATPKSGKEFSWVCTHKVS
jgi:2-polyprenyl-6-methoxyphenol hydroxylase-like FAD-dependent oxidoreductase